MANFNFNKTIIGGRLTDDPELKTTPTGVSVTSFTVAVNRKIKKDGETVADFFTVQAWRQTAEFITKHFKKASSICVVGTLQNRNWTDSNGVKHYVTEIVADEACFVDSKSEHQPSGDKATPNEIPPHFEEIGEDEELPF